MCDRRDVSRQAGCLSASTRFNVSHTSQQRRITYSFFEDWASPWFGFPCLSSGRNRFPPLTPYSPRNVRHPCENIFLKGPKNFLGVSAGALIFQGYRLLAIHVEYLEPAFLTTSWCWILGSTWIPTRPHPRNPVSRSTSRAWAAR